MDIHMVSIQQSIVSACPHNPDLMRMDRARPEKIAADFKNGNVNNGRLTMVQDVKKLITPLPFKSPLLDTRSLCNSTSEAYKHMEKIEHTKVATNGINMHVASIGKGPPILFLHGFPELWYSWRHQLLSLSSLGYRCIAPDLRGYGDTDAPGSVTEYTIFHIVGDLVGLLDALQIEQVFLVGHNWGAIIAWYLCMFRPERIKALVNTSVPFLPRNPNLTLVQRFRNIFGDDFYICRYQKPGEAEAEYAEIDIAKMMRIVLTHRDPCPQTTLPKGIEKLHDPSTLPSWLSDEDISYFANKFNHTGFTGGINYYRNFDRNWELTAAWNGAQVKVPVKFIIGDLDLVYNFPGMKEYIHNGEFKKDVPLLEEVIIMEGVAHYLNQEKPDQVSNHIYNFIKKF